MGYTRSELRQHNPGEPDPQGEPMTTKITVHPERCTKQNLA